MAQDAETPPSRRDTAKIPYLSNHPDPRAREEKKTRIFFNGVDIDDLPDGHAIWYVVPTQ